jgi:hypothetical protein
MVFKDMDDRTGQKIARKDIWVGAIATRTVVRELFDLSAFFAEQTVMLRVMHGHAPYHPWHNPDRAVVSCLWGRPRSLPVA